MARYRNDEDGRPGGGNGKNKDWGKGATEGSDLGDHLQGEHGVDDTIDGMEGDDNINGFSGDDVLIGGTGADDITTGQGWDTVALGEYEAAGEDDLAENDFYGADEADDTVNIDVNDDSPVIEDEVVSDAYDLIGGYEGAVEGTGDDEGTYTTHDVIDLGDMGGALGMLVEDDQNLNEPGAVGDVVNSIDGGELQGFLWVTEEGELVFDADGSGEESGEDILAKLMQPSGGNEIDGFTNDAAVDGVTVHFEAEIEVVLAVDDITGFVTDTETQTAEYVAIWENDAWLVSVDGGDFIA